MLKKARQAEHGNHPTILSRWYEQEGSLAEHNLAKRKSCFRPHRYYTASEAERLQNAKHWVLRLNADGPQKKPLRQRPEFAVATKKCLQMQNAHLAETQQSLRPVRPEHQQRQREDQQFEGGENFDYYVDRKNWMAVLQKATGKPVGSGFIFNIAVARLTMGS